MAMQEAIITTSSCRNFLHKLGLRLVLVKQIHEQDCYYRLGRAGGVRAVLPVHDIASYSTMVTLVNFDSTVSATPNAVDFYDDQLAQFKIQLMNKSGNPSWIEARARGRPRELQDHAWRKTAWLR